jgi:hypothetical protein
MKALQSSNIGSPVRLAVAALLAQLLERLDRSAAPVGAEQYRSVVRHLAEEFEELQSHQGLSPLLDAFPSAAELYENLNYRHAGLCRSPLEASLDAEMQARRLIERARRGPAAVG